MCPLMIAWAINCQPSLRLTSLVLSWACLQTQLMTPDNVNVVSHASPKLSPSPNHRTGRPNLGQLLQLLLGHLCHLKPCLPQLAPATHEGVVVSLLHLWWRSPVFPNSTESQASQVLASLPETEGEPDGALPNTSGSSGPFQPLGCMRVWPSVWILTPGF